MADDLGFEHELVQPVQSVNGATLYNKVTRGACRPLDLETKQPIDYGSEALLIELDGAGNQVRMSARTDGVNCCHLLRQTLAPIVEEPAGYYVMESAASTTRMESAASTTRYRFIRDGEGKLTGAEIEQGAKPRTGFAVSDEAA
jgi:hypothetical protein